MSKDESWRATHGRTFWIGRSITFSASHRLPNVPASHKCGRHHGHTYVVAIEVEGVMDPTTGWVIDFGHLDVVMRQLVFDVLDHRHLNDIPGLENPTAEVLCDWIAKRVAAHVDGIAGRRLARVQVREGEHGGWASLPLPAAPPPIVLPAPPSAAVDAWDMGVFMLGDRT